MTRDPVREALVSARIAAHDAWIRTPTNDPMEDQLYYNYESYAKLVREYDARTTPAASSDAGAQDTEKDNREADENDRNQG